MVVLYSDAISFKKEEMANQKQMQNTMDKQNEMQKEQHKLPNPMA
jgi:hypothetical protein